MHFAQSKSTKYKILAVSWTPLDKKLKKNPSIWQGKSVCKGFQICTYRFLCMPIEMHYVRTLCDKYFLSYCVFSAFFMGKVKIQGSETWCRGKMGPQEDFWIGPIPLSLVFNPILCYMSPKIEIFHEPLIVETCNKCHWVHHASNPKYVPLKQFQCIFCSQN